MQQLAEAQGERSEVAAKLAESREEVARLRAGVCVCVVCRVCGGGVWRGGWGQGLRVGGHVLPRRRSARPAALALAAFLACLSPPRRLPALPPRPTPGTAWHRLVPRPCAGPDGELRSRIERLEKDLVIQRNRAEVNALFKEEHDRWAGGW